MIHRSLLADRLCYLDKGIDGLRARHEMQRAYREDERFWWDEYDTKALQQMREKSKKKEDET